MTRARSGWRVVILSSLRVLIESLGTELRRAGFANVLDAVPSSKGAGQVADEQHDLLFLYDGSTRARVDALPRDLGVQQLSCTVVFGLAESAHDLAVCVRLGVPGLLHSDASVEQLLAALDVVRQGGVFMLAPVRNASVRQPGDPAPENPAETLTPREREVAALIARGLSNKEIATTLRAGLGTVKSHVRHVMAKLGLHHRAGVDAALRAWSAVAPSQMPRDADRLARGTEHDGRGTPLRGNAGWRTD